MYEEESELIQALLRGDGDAPREFLQRYSRLAYAILLREFWFSRSEAEDCFQTTLERLVEDNYRRIRLWRREGPFYSYFAQTVRNVARNFVRQRRNVDVLEAQQDDCDLEFDPPDPNPGPERWTILAEVRSLLEHCIRRLAEQAENVFRMRHFEEQSYEEIAEQATMTIGHVGVTLSRAERQVRECLRRRMGESQVEIFL